MPETILSGIRATGRLHFGNFLGAVQNFVAYQKAGHTCLYFVADYHTLTTLPDPALLRANLIEIVKDYIAAGLDPNDSILYAQSSVPEITELSYLLSCFQSIGALQNVPTFKDLVRKQPDNVTLALLTYPVLMAADILGPRATLVPVGEDQVPNLELARELARKFNRLIGDEFFPVPEPMSDMVKVPGLDGFKMGKSEKMAGTDQSNAIDINDPIEVIRERYMRHAITDPDRVRRDMPGDPYNGCRSVYPLHEMVTPGETDTRTIADQCRKAEIGCVDCKNLLVDRIGEVLVPFQDRRAELANDDDYIRDILGAGAAKARELILPTIEEVRSRMGLVRFG